MPGASSGLPRGTVSQAFGCGTQTSAHVGSMHMKGEDFLKNFILVLIFSFYDPIRVFKNNEVIIAQIAEMIK